jgi:hypothetical protein
MTVAYEDDPWAGTGLEDSQSLPLRHDPPPLAVDESPTAKAGQETATGPPPPADRKSS